MKDEHETKIDLRRIVLFDHHAHSLRTDFNQLDVLGFRQAFTESNSMGILQDHVQHSISYMHMLRELGKVLDIEGEQNIIDMRSQLRPDDYCELLFDEASIGTLIIDDGFNSAHSLSLDRLAEMSSRPIYRCLRLETLFESLIGQADNFDNFLQLVHAALTATSTSRLVALKTIAAYRGGLTIDEVDKGSAQSDYDEARRSLSKNKSAQKIQRRPFYHFALRECFEKAGELNVPVQLHCGIGDSDADLLESNPLKLRSILESSRFRKTNFVFLHCYPYVKEAAFLSSLYNNAYFDLSLACTLLSSSLDSIFYEAISGAPFSKILAATDGHSIPETHWYGALSLRRGLSRALTAFVEKGFVSLDEALKIASAIFYENTMRLYQLND